MCDNTPYEAQLVQVTGMVKNEPPPWSPFSHLLINRKYVQKRKSNKNTNMFYLCREGLCVNLWVKIVFPSSLLRLHCLPVHLTVKCRQIAKTVSVFLALLFHFSALYPVALQELGSDCCFFLL